MVCISFPGVSQQNKQDSDTNGTGPAAWSDGHDGHQSLATTALVPHSHASVPDAVALAVTATAAAALAYAAAATAELSAGAATALAYGPAATVVPHGATAAVAVAAGHAEPEPHARCAEPGARLGAQRHELDGSALSRQPRRHVATQPAAVTSHRYSALAGETRSG